MGFRFQAGSLNRLLAHLGETYRIFAPVRCIGGNAFSDTDLVRYAPVTQIEPVVFDQQSAYSFKEALLPITQSLFFFTEEQVKEADPPRQGAIVFLRSCDMHGVKRLDDLYLRNGPEDYYYKRIRDRIRFVLMGCTKPFDTCFCTTMETNHCETYDLSIEPAGNSYMVDCKADDWAAFCSSYAEETLEVKPSFVTESPVKVRLPQNLTQDALSLPLWDDYDSRCTNCGRCNFVCPTCTCYTMQDLFYTDNGRVGERRRVWASCMVDGFTDVAGGGSYRQKNGQRMRFKTLHKIWDHKQRFDHLMCVGCGRCDPICPEYISFTHIINALEEATRC